MNLRAGLLLSFIVVVAQWLVVAGFVAHSYTWWLKVERSTVTAGYVMTIVFSLGSVMAISYGFWAHDRLYLARSPWRFAAMLVALGGLAGVLVFAGMIQVGHVILVDR